MASEEAGLQHFKAIPWCAKLLQDPAFEVTPTRFRQRKASTEDSLFAEILSSENTIPACITMIRRSPGSAIVIDEMRVLLQLGDRLNSYAYVCHGGMVGMIMDEAMGKLLIINEETKHGELKENVVTASLKTNFMKPVRTPGTILTTARFKSRSGRKHVLEASIKDGDGAILATAEALWVVVPGMRGQNL